MGDNASVRIGPISLFTLIAVICLATLAVLSMATANASHNLAQLQATSMTEQYEAEDAAQDFVARLDAAHVSAAVTAPAAPAAADAAQGVDAPAQDAGATADAGTLTGIVAECEAAGDGRVAIDAQMTGSTVSAQFTCESGRVLEIELVLDGGTYSIVKWNMTAMENVEQTDTLWLGM